MTFLLMEQLDDTEICYTIQVKIYFTQFLIITYSNGANLM